MSDNKKLITKEEFEQLSGDEMFEYTKLVKGNSKTEDFQEATGLGFSYTTFTNLLKKKGIYRSGDTWLRQPVDGSDDKEIVNLFELAINDPAYIRSVYSKATLDDIDMISKRIAITKPELMNLALSRLIDDLKQGKIRFVGEYSELDQ